MPRNRFDFPNDTFVFNDAEPDSAAGVFAAQAAEPVVALEVPDALPAVAFDFAAVNASAAAEAPTSIFEPITDRPVLFLNPTAEQVALYYPEYLGLI